MDEVANIGYYLRGEKKAWLKSCHKLGRVLEDIKVKGRGSIWVVKEDPEDDGEIAPKIKKQRSNAEERQNVYRRGLMT